MQATYNRVYSKFSKRPDIPRGKSMKQTTIESPHGIRKKPNFPVI